MKDFEYDNDILYNIIKGLVTGFLIAYLIILGLRPASLYPDNILDIIDNPWIFIILLIINFYVIQWDLTIGLLLFLSIIALILDIIIFTEGKIFYYEENNEKFKNDNVVNTISSTESISFPPYLTIISMNFLFNSGSVFRSFINISISFKSIIYSYAFVSAYISVIFFRISENIIVITATCRNK